MIKLGMYLSKKAGITDNKEIEKLCYGLELIYEMLSKTIVVLLAGWLLGIFYETVLAVITMAALRSLAGGAHVQTSFACLLISLLFTTLPALVVSNIEASFFLVVSTLILVTEYLPYVPGGTYYAPVETAGDVQERKSIYILLGIIVPAILGVLDARLGLIVSLVSYMTVILTTPQVYYVFKEFRHNYE